MTTSTQKSPSSKPNSLSELQISKLQLLRELRTAKQAADAADAANADVFGMLGYEPNCLPRAKAAEQGLDVPACGQCPQELFHAATEWDVLFGGSAGGGKVWPS